MPIYQSPIPLSHSFWSLKPAQIPLPADPDRIQDIYITWIFRFDRAIL